MRVNFHCALGIETLWGGGFPFMAVVYGEADPWLAAVVALLIMVLPISLFL